MTEQEWLTCTNAQQMFDLARGKVSRRKLRLFACAFSRRMWHLLSDKRGRAAVKIAERYADGEAVEEDLRQARHRTWEAAWKSRRGDSARDKHPLRSMAWEAVSAAIADDISLPGSIQLVLTTFLDTTEEESLSQPCDLFREVFGLLPFDLIKVDPVWLCWQGGLLVSMAKQMYEARDFRDLPVLADALEEAGCDNNDILDHCRQDGEHTRGCWVTDLLMGRE